MGLFATLNGNEIQQIKSATTAKLNSWRGTIVFIEWFIAIPSPQMAPNRGCLTAMKSALEEGANLWLTFTTQI